MVVMKLRILIDYMLTRKNLLKWVNDLKAFRRLSRVLSGYIILSPCTPIYSSHPYSTLDAPRNLSYNPFAPRSFRNLLPDNTICHTHHYPRLVHSYMIIPPTHTLLYFLIQALFHLTNFVLLHPFYTTSASQEVHSHLSLRYIHTTSVSHDHRVWFPPSTVTHFSLTNIFIAPPTFLPLISTILIYHHTLI